MKKTLFIAEKPSVATEFAKALRVNASKKDGFMESEEFILTWCVGHLVTMSYPEKYDSRLKKWDLATLPFMPEEYRYEIIPGVQKQFETVKRLLNREDVETIFVCTDSGREGEYIYRLVEQLAGVKGKDRKRVWIDSQTEEEILKGIREARDLTEYDNLAASAYLRAKEDYLMGINFSRVLTLKYGRELADFLGSRYCVVSVGRVMTCVLGMVVRREREIRDFVKKPFYRVLAQLESGSDMLETEWKVQEESYYNESPYLYKDNGFSNRNKAQELLERIREMSDNTAVVEKVENKKENKNPPLLFNLAELQNDCSRLFKISPDETLKITQLLYEKKLVTYPRTDARVLSTAVVKEIEKNISGLKEIYPEAAEILSKGLHKSIAKSRYVNDSKITDHYAIIPTGQGLGGLRGLKPEAARVYELIARRFLSIFYPPAVYKKLTISFMITTQEHREMFVLGTKILVSEGYLKVAGSADNEETTDKFQVLKNIKKGDKLPVNDIWIKEGETSPPKRYTSGSIILAMENAGQLIEDEQLREQIKGSGIGTSATRAEILKKLETIKYLSLNKKTQIISPALLGEMVYDVVNASIKSLLNPDLTASWEKGLNYVADGEITSAEYMVKLQDFVGRRVNAVKTVNNQRLLVAKFHEISNNYK
ncbi:DNA topoisomerase III [Parasporobacterium paucivorans]|uniref:DNA topoisomerase n=1 Tax=Parasporobacterium paucivorans DSM 15970 TaxID=1122934 RepID=A0A1M6G483_9FIRM|nr:DNA topoisomerase III [Parasporobacterium paucivorans]SHJ04778.1 DNA topoisomerase-3 [Parasporobacterium paucivorans DSM 15970]